MILENTGVVKLSQFKVVLKITLKMNPSPYENMSKFEKRLG